MADALLWRPRQSARIQLGRLARVLLVGALFLTLGLVPGVGPLLAFAYRFYVMRRATRNWKLALVYALLSLHPYLKIKFAVLFQTWLASRALTRALLQPYFRHVPLLSFPSSADMCLCGCSRVGDVSYEHAVLRGNNWLLLGFGLPLYALLLVPFAGPLFFCMGQAAAAQLVLRLLDSGKWDALQLRAAAPS